MEPVTAWFSQEEQSAAPPTEIAETSPVYYTGVKDLLLLASPGGKGVGRLPLYTKVWRYRLERGYAYVKVEGTEQQGWVDSTGLIRRLPIVPGPASTGHTGKPHPQAAAKPKASANPTPAGDSHHPEPTPAPSASEGSTPSEAVAPEPAEPVTSEPSKPERSATESKPAPASQPAASPEPAVPPEPEPAAAEPQPTGPSAPASAQPPTPMPPKPKTADAVPKPPAAPSAPSVPKVQGSGTVSPSIFNPY